MVSQRKHFDDAQLRAIVFGEEDSEEYVLAASHVECCDACQNRLRELAGSENDELEAGLLLSDYESQGSTEKRPSKDDEATYHSELQFLAPPSHPEMLGRLGRYEIERIIGSGGMGVVLKGFDTELNRPVAIKILAKHLAHSGAARRRFAREARAAAAVVHEHVVAIHNVESDGEVSFLVMQYVAGESLQTRVDREGPLEAKEILRIGMQAAAGLAAAHEQGVVHRDIKPANILLENGIERVLITDFGLARTVDDASLTHTGVVAGTPHYMAPEQANGEPTDQRTDLFSLGSVLYFMATGHPPFRAERMIGVLHRICHDRQRPVWETNAEIPDEISDVIDRLLEKKPAKRFASAAELREVLSRLLADSQNGSLRRRSRVGRLVHRRSQAAMAVLLGMIIAAVGVIVMTRPPDERPVNANTRASRPATSPAATESPDVAYTVESLRLTAQQYAVTSGQVSARLQQLEDLTRPAAPRFPQVDFQQQIMIYEQRLDALQSEMFSGPVTSFPESGVQP